VLRDRANRKRNASEDEADDASDMTTNDRLDFIKAGHASLFLAAEVALRGGPGKDVSCALVDHHVDLP